MKFSILLTSLLTLSSYLAQADQKFVARPEVQSYIEQQAKTGLYTHQELEALFNEITPQPSVLKILDRPSTARPWYQFRPILLTEARINGGIVFWQQHQEALQRAEKQYGVPAALIVAIIGIESNYGSNKGNYRVIDVLATIGFDYPRRANYFRGELTELLKLAKEEKKDPLSFKGSYAGAMGLPQFMPSSFRKWAVDFDHKGQRDIWGNPDDAIGSIANYMHQYGWLNGDDIVVAAKVGAHAPIAKLTAEKFNLHYRVDELEAMDITPEPPLPKKVLAVLVPLESAPGVTEYWLGLNNFYVITRYNKSILYAKAVEELAQAIKLRYLASTAPSPNH